jgi:hypothetical protein
MSRRFVWSAALVLFSTAQSLAGVIPWSYQANLESVGGIPPGNSPALVGLGSVSIHDAEVGQLNGNSGSAWGWRTVSIGSITLASEQTPDTTWRLAPGTFQMAMTLNDITSGQHSVLNYSGSASITGNQVRDFWGSFITIDDLHVNASISPTDAQTIMLGGNPYTVSVEAINHPNGTAYLEADVRAGSINETPEPATIISAVVGVGIISGGAIRRILRRR